MCEVEILDLAIWIAERVEEGFVDEPDEVFKMDLRIRIEKLIENFISRVDAEWPEDPAPIAALAQAALKALNAWDDELLLRLTDRLSHLAKDLIPFPEPESAPESPAYL
jgi:hypothetical protein